ncbi:MAG: Cyclase/dehydrase [Nitrospira sp.]|nr:Cyclase/dehydrase [Nitrospira sp.]
MTTRSLQRTRPRTTRASKSSSKKMEEASASGQHVQAVGDRISGNGNGSLTQEERLAYGLGWFGIGLGLTELMMPRRLAQATGLPFRHRRLIQIMGLREIASGLGIITQRKPAGPRRGNP